MKTNNMLMITRGAYDGYHIRCLLKVLKDFDLETVKAQYMSEHTKYNERCEQHEKKEDCENFEEWLCTEGYTEELDYSEIHTGDYSEIEIEGTQR